MVFQKTCQSHYTDGRFLHTSDQGLVKYCLCCTLKKCQLLHIIQTQCLVQVDLVQSYYVLKRWQWIFLLDLLTTNHHSTWPTYRAPTEPAQGIDKYGFSVTTIATPNPKPKLSLKNGVPINFECCL